MTTLDLFAPTAPTVPPATRRAALQVARAAATAAGYAGGLAVLWFLFCVAL